LIQIGPVTAEILLIWTNVPRTNVAWTNVVCYTLDNLIFVSKVSIPNLSLLVSLEVVKKFVVGGWVGGWVVSKPILVFSLRSRSS